jgi:thiol-disulfide isomerase/thioredoxin
LLRAGWVGLLILALLWLPAEAATVPRPSPEYAVKLTTGQQLLLSSYRGKVVALLFISTDCPHCADTCQLMERIQKEYGPRGLQTLAVAFNPMAIMLVPEFVQRTRVTFPVGYDERDPVLKYLGISPMLRLYVPIIVFVDRKGMIRGQHLGDDGFFADREKNIRSTLENLLREPATMPARGAVKKGSGAGSK